MRAKTLSAESDVAGVEQSLGFDEQSLGILGGRADAALDESLDLALGQRAHEGVHHLALMEGDHRRDRLNPQLLGDLGIGVDIHLGEPHLAAPRRHDLLDDRRELAAGAAPGRPEIDQHQTPRRFVDDLGAKVLERHVDDVRAGGGGGLGRLID